MQQNPNQPTSTSSLDDMLKGFQKKLDDLYTGFVDEFTSYTFMFDEFNATMAEKMGQTQVVIANLRKETAIALPAVISLGGELSDVQNIQLGITQQLNTNIIAMGETVTDLYAGAKAVGIGSDQVGVMVEKFQSAGIQVDNISEVLQSTVDTARALGVNTSAAFKGVEGNLDKINKFGFQNGVDGLAKMATQAASLRINMNDIFNFAEKTFDPEGATEMVSLFQRMGVAAGDLADPFRLMYLASEDTEELSNQVAKMTEKFTYFDEKSKSFKVFPNAKRDLREISQQTGIGYDDLIKMSQAGQKMQMLAKDFKLAGIDEESKQFIANVATYSKEKGGFTVKVSGEQKLVSELKGDDLTALKEAQQPVTLEELARDQLSTQQLELKTLEAIKAQGLAPGLGSRAPQDLTEVLRGTYKAAGASARASAGNIRGGVEKLDNVYEKTGQSMSDIITGKGGLKQLQEILFEGISNTKDGFERMGKTIEKFDYGAVMKPQISAGNKIYEASALVLEKVKNMANSATANFAKGDEKRKSTLPTTQTQTTNVNFNDVKVQGSFDVNLKNTDGSTQKLSQEQVQQIINSETFRKAIQKSIQDMQAKAPYSNVPNKVPGG